jgi:hypothetical protein
MKRGAPPSREEQAILFIALALPIWDATRIRPKMGHFTDARVTLAHHLLSWLDEVK